MTLAPALRCGGRAVALALLATAALAGGPAAGAASKLRGAGPAAARGITAAELEERHGLKVTLIGVTGAGGLVDVRFKVLDPDKARPLLGDHHHLPRLVAVKSGQTLTASHQAARGVSLRKDGVSFILYPNVRGAVRRGTRVAIAFANDVRLEPMAAQ